MMYLGKKTVTQAGLSVKLGKAKTLIDEGGGDGLSVAMLAREAGLSESHFSRCFKELFGVSPYRYCLEKKIHRSAHLLVSSQLALTAIAHELGFSELSAFSRRFKKIYGMSPLMYKRAMVPYNGLT